MTPVSKLKKGVRYRYYVSSALHQGQRAKAGSMDRAPADQIEKLVVDAVQTRLEQKSSPKLKGAQPHAIDSGKRSIRDYVVRVDVFPNHLKIQMSVAAIPDQEGVQRSAHVSNKTDSAQKMLTLSVPWKKSPSKVAREILAPSNGDERTDNRPIRSETRAKLVTSIAKGRRWLAEILEGNVTSDVIAKRERCSVRQVNMMASLAFLSPQLVRAALEGRLPRGVGIAALRDFPAIWSAQHKELGLALFHR